MPPPARPCRLTSIQIHLNPQGFPKDSLTEKAGPRSRQARASSDTGRLHLLSEDHLLLSGHVPLAGRTLSKHRELPGRGELVGHIAGHTVGEPGLKEHSFNNQAWVHRFCALHRRDGGGAGSGGCGGQHVTQGPCLAGMQLGV